MCDEPTRAICGDACEWSSTWTPVEVTLTRSLSARGGGERAKDGDSTSEALRRMVDVEGGVGLSQSSTVSSEPRCIFLRISCSMKEPLGGSNLVGS